MSMQLNIIQQTQKYPTFSYEKQMRNLNTLVSKGSKCIRDYVM